MSNKKIGILTYHFANNFGAVFQAYALQRLLTSLGYDSEFIDYQPRHVERGGSFRLPTSKTNIKANVVTAYQKITTFKQQVLGDGGRAEKFRQFRKDNLIVGTRRYESLNDLKTNSPAYDCVVCGSDQIWNSSVQFGIDPAYFLDFGKAQMKRVSFAPSFGKGAVDTENELKVGQLLKRFDHLSVRESSGIDIVRRLAEREATCVPDPTLMFDDYQEITSTTTEKDAYIMSYVLRSAEMVTDVQLLVAEHLGLPLIVPNDRFLKKRKIGKAIDPTPSQWLGYFRDAKFVVTNSFHGTAFSIILRKPFISVGITGRKSGVNDRAKSLLERLGLQDRFVDRFDIASIKQKISEPIDWDKATSRLSTWRKESNDFLTRSLS